LLEIDTIRPVLAGIDAAYFVYPIRPGLIHATVNFAQAVRETGGNVVLNLSQRSANREATSNSSRDTYISEQVFNWSGSRIVGGAGPEDRLPEPARGRVRRLAGRDRRSAVRGPAS
jgi:NAD(P)H dehydrogenase (quinone)